MSELAEEKIIDLESALETGAEQMDKESLNNENTDGSEESKKRVDKLSQSARSLSFL